MNTGKLDILIKNKNLQEIVKIRDSYDMYSEEWHYLNQKKADIMELTKPSTIEDIIYFAETDLKKIPEGYSKQKKLPFLKYYVGKRSLLEYDPNQRHPIPYVIVRHKDEYFFTLRDKGSGEERLIGEIGLIGGHIKKENINPLSIQRTILNGLKSEIREEAGINDGMIINAKYHGIIKLNEGVHGDHLGIIYEVVLNTRDIKSQEDGILQGIWLHKNKLTDYYNQFELWAKIVYDNILNKASPLK